MAYFVVFGRPKKHEKLLRAQPNKSTTWTINPKARIGNRVVFYFTSPTSAFVATGEVASKPKLQPKRTEWEGKYMAVIKGIRNLEPNISRESVLNRIPSWGYPKMPIQSSKIPSQVLPQFLKMLRGRAGDDTNADSTDNAKGSGRRHQPNPLRRERIEKIAITTTSEYFGEKGLGYTVDSFEKDNVGWDLTAVLGKNALQLEVKGLSGAQVVVELTPNEYRAMKANRDSYRVCVVSNALTNPHLDIFAYNADTARWQNSEGLKLDLQEIVAVRCSAK